VEVGPGEDDGGDQEETEDLVAAEGAEQRFTRWGCTAGFDVFLIEMLLDAGGGHGAAVTSIGERWICLTGEKATTRTTADPSLRLKDGYGQDDTTIFSETAMCG
jgi:hypothetical protein